MRAVHLHLEELGQRLDHNVERACQEQHAVAGALVLANPAHALGIDTPERDGVQGFTAEAFHDVRVEAFVLAVEASLELRARPPLEIEPSRPLAQDVREERRPVLQRLRAKAHPQEVLDNVGLHEGAVDVEHSQHIGAAGPAFDGRAD